MNNIDISLAINSISKVLQRSQNNQRLCRFYKVLMLLLEWKILFIVFSGVLHVW